MLWGIIVLVNDSTPTLVQLYRSFLEALKSFNILCQDYRGMEVYQCPSWFNKINSTTCWMEASSSSTTPWAFIPSNGCSCSCNTCWINHKVCWLLLHACTGGVKQSVCLCVCVSVMQCISCPNFGKFAVKNDFKTTDKPLYQYFIST